MLFDYSLARQHPIKCIECSPFFSWKRIGKEFILSMSSRLVYT
jgi:hypothetical protein